MAKDATNPGSSARARTEELRREIEASSAEAARPARSATALWGIAIWTVFALVVGAVAAWTRERPLVEAGRVMTDTRTAAARFTFADADATARARDMARARTARVYVGVPGLLEEVRKGLDELPLVARDAASPEEVEKSIREQFGLSEPSLAVLKAQVRDGAVSARWHGMVAALVDELARHPILKREEAQLESQALSKQMELRQGGGGGSGGEAAKPVLVVPSANAINVEAPDIGKRLRQLARDAGFEGPLLDVVASRLTQPLQPTYTFEKGETTEAQNSAANAVPDQVVTYPEKEVIYRRGDVLTQAQLDIVKAAARAEKREESARQVWTQRAAVVGLVGLITLAIAGYTYMFVPRIRRNPARAGAVALLLGVGACVACYASAEKPGLMALTAVAPTVLCTMVLCVAYTQRTALAYGALHGLLVAAALDEPVGTLAVVLAGVGAAVWRLGEVRDRDTLIKAGVFVGLALALATMLAGLVALPLTMVSVSQAAVDAGWAGAAGLGAAMVMLFVLPTLEKSFGITTGLTLIELRDPKQPLLRQLQQRAPGTYNHSLTVAALGESAAEAIGADGLLTYVGALYHDIGKMNKPDYFVENQTPGFNRHDKLSPAMSLLIIVGHVKDGLELSREFGLPRALWHFIESHHGTTLVEYFYHRARSTSLAARGASKGNGGTGGAAKVVAQDDDEGPSEMEYRYPGPRPRTREAAIVMICDAVESAARTMGDPTPSRIDALVRAIATKRLMDGQFDECDLTLRELNLIVEAVSRTLASIHHARIAYPEEVARAEARKAEEARPVVPVAGTIGERVGNGVGGESKVRDRARA